MVVGVSGVAEVACGWDHGVVVEWLSGSATNFIFNSFSLALSREGELDGVRRVNQHPSSSKQNRGVNTSKSG